MRPPLSQERLEWRTDGRLELTLTNVWKHGTRALVLEDGHPPRALHSTSAAHLRWHCINPVPPAPAGSRSATRHERNRRSFGLGAEHSAVGEALAGVRAACAELSVPWYLFGAQAALVYGSPRLTADIDITVQLGSVITDALPMGSIQAGECVLAGRAGCVVGTTPCTSRSGGYRSGVSRTVVRVCRSHLR